MEKDKIKIVNAFEKNLKNIDLEIPKNKLVIITGVSGSGKSTLAFDVIYNEGKRKYIDSLSNYAKQFLGNTKKPMVESIEGLTPSIAIDQKTTSNNPRSTVGTITEIYDFYRLLFSRIGTPYCPNHNIPIKAQSTTQIIDDVFKFFLEKKIQILSPQVTNKNGDHSELLEDLKKKGYIRVKINGEIKRLDSKIVLDVRKKNSISILVDRLEATHENRSRIYEAIEMASTYSDGLVEIDNIESKETKLYSKKFVCKLCGFQMPKIENNLFSFNSPFGHCKDCHGLGVLIQVTPNKLFNKELSILDGGIKIFPIDRQEGIYWGIFLELAKFYKIDLSKKIEDLSKREIDIIMNGSKDLISYQVVGPNGNIYKKTEYIEGLAKSIERRNLNTTSEAAKKFYGKFMSEMKCKTCEGKRLNEYALAVKLKKLDIAELSEKTVNDAYDWATNLSLSEKEEEIVMLVLIEIQSRLKFLKDVGLGYIGISRLAGTLSGGESQRIRLATQIGSKLTGVTYVLDEPSIGLHQQDNDKLINSLKEMRDIGNSVIVVEHDEDTMLQADWIIDIGPKAGDNGGEIVAQGDIEKLKNSKTLTGDFLSKRNVIEIPKEFREEKTNYIEIIGASQNNLKNINVKIPLKKLVAITGVSGSGKSTLINEILYKNLANKLHNDEEYFEPGKVKKIKGLEYIDKVIYLSQSPIGRTPRSNPATYTSLYTDIRDVFAKTKDARERGFDIGRFSFNVRGGRCEVCQGAGVNKISMHFLPDVYIECEECNGTRFNEETLQIKYRDKTISDVLKMTVDEALEFFSAFPSIKRKVEFLQKVGLGYITLGHSATDLSGGESQRVKLAKYLQKRPTGRSLYILDEPTTGLHNYDIKILLKVLHQLVDGGDSMIIIEHNLDLIKTADWIIDLGPGGGDEGGKVIAEGNILSAKTLDSPTFNYLKRIS